MEAGYNSVVVDISSRDQANSVPLWKKDNFDLKPNLIQNNTLGSTPLVKVNMPYKQNNKTLVLWVREKTLSNSLLEQMLSDNENPQTHLSNFLDALDKAGEKALDSTSPLILAEDVERIFPNALGRFLDILDNLLGQKIEFVPSTYLESKSTSREVNYVPASTMEGDDSMWIATLDDKLFREHIERLSIQIEDKINFENPKSKEEKDIRDRLLKIQDSGFYFWRFIPRTREPFYREIQFLENWLNQN